MKKIVKITDGDIRNIIRESIKELDNKTLYRASSKADWLVDYDDVDAALNEIRRSLEKLSRGYFYDRGDGGGYEGKNNKGFENACKGLEALESFFTRKRKQMENLRDAWQEVEFGMTNDERDEFYDSL